MRGKVLAALCCVICLLLAAGGMAEEAGVLFLPADLTEIGPEAFYGLKDVTKVVLPAGVGEIGSGAFGGSESLKEIEIGSAGTVFVAEDVLKDSPNAAFTGGSVVRYREDNGSAVIRGYDGTAKELTIPGTLGGLPVTKIDTECFRGNEQLAKVVLPENLTLIENGAFRDCAALTDVTFPDSLTKIESNAFAGCGTAAEAAFRFDLPDGVTLVGKYAFDQCPAILTCGRDSDTAKTVSDRGYTFARNDRPEELDFRYRWGYYGHEYEVGLAGYAGSDSPVRLPDDCTAADYNGLKDLVAGGLVCAQLSDTAAALARAELNFTFPGHEDIRYRVIEDVLYVMGFAGSGKEINIPVAEEYVKAGVDEQIRRNAFKGCETVTKAVIPEGVTKIGDAAFMDCYQLTDVTFPDSLRFIDTNAFRWMGQKAENAEDFRLDLPDDLTDIVGRGGGATTFSDCNAVLVCGKTSATAALLTDRNYVYAARGEDGNLRYRYEADKDGEETVRRLWLVGYEGTADEVSIPEGIYGIKRFSSDKESNFWRTFRADAFYGNEALKKVVIPEGTVIVEDSAFLGCVSLTDVTFPKSLRILKNHAFEKCGSGSDGNYYYMLPPDIREIAGIGGAGWESFNGITGTLVCAPDSETAYVLSAGNYNFALNGHHTDGLLYRYENREIDGEKKWRLYLYKYTGSAGTLEIPGDVGLYGVSRTPPGGSDPWISAFRDNKSLKKVVIPEGVVIIQDSAFMNCTLLTDITLPSTLRRVMNHAFENTGTAAGKRFIVELPEGITEMQCNNGAGWASFNRSAAVLVAPKGSWVAHELYENWWVYYLSRDLAELNDPAYATRKPHDLPFDWNGNV